jgi:hypothetical protein
LWWYLLEYDVEYEHLGWRAYVWRVYPKWYNPSLTGNPSVVAGFPAVLLNDRRDGSLGGVGERTGRVRGAAVPCYTTLFLPAISLFQPVRGPAAYFVLDVVVAVAGR